MVEVKRVKTESTIRSDHYRIERRSGCAILRLVSSAGTNLLSWTVIVSLLDAVEALADGARHGELTALILTGNEKFLSAGANLNEVTELTAAASFELARLGQRLMNTVDSFPAPVIASIHGYCMGGGMDLALACDYRIAAPNAMFGHRGAALGIMTGWGGTQRLPRLIGKARALQMFLLAETLDAQEAQRIGLVNEVNDDPLSRALTWISRDRQAL